MSKIYPSIIVKCAKSGLFLFILASPFHNAMTNYSIIQYDYKRKGMGGKLWIQTRDRGMKVGTDKKDKLKTMYN